MTPGDPYFDRSREDSAYIAAASLLRTFQLDSALQHINNYHHILLSGCVFLRRDCVCTYIQSGQEVTIPLLTQHVYLYVCNIPKYTVKLEGVEVQLCQYPYGMSSATAHYTQHMTCAWQHRYGYRYLSDTLYVALTTRHLFKGHRSAITTKFTSICLKSF